MNNDNNLTTREIANILSRKAKENNLNDEDIVNLVFDFFVERQIDYNEMMEIYFILGYDLENSLEQFKNAEIINTEIFNDETEIPIEC